MVKPCKQMYLSLLLLIGSGSAVAIEQPDYKVLKTAGDFELRQYAPMIIAETVVTGDMSDASGNGFRRIAGYIFGDNNTGNASVATGTTSVATGATNGATVDEEANSEKISMTAPVTMTSAEAGQGDSEKISMTAPVKMKQTDGAWRVHFVMPSEYTMATLPRPNSDQVQLREISERRYAVIRFSGLAGEEKVATQTNALLDWMKEQNLEPIGQPELARYNPPWTLPFLRRNEVMLQYQ